MAETHGAARVRADTPVENGHPPAPGEATAAGRAQVTADNPGKAAVGTGSLPHPPAAAEPQARDGGMGVLEFRGPFHGSMAVEYEQAGRQAVRGGLSAEYINGWLIQWMTENAGCTIIRVFDAVAEAQEKFPPGTRVTREDHQPAMRWTGTVTGGHAAADVGGCTVTVEWDWHGTSSAVPVTALHAEAAAVTGFKPRGDLAEYNTAGQAFTGPPGVRRTADRAGRPRTTTSATPQSRSPRSQ